MKTRSSVSADPVKQCQLQNPKKKLKQKAFSKSVQDIDPKLGLSLRNKTCLTQLRTPPSEKKVLHNYCLRSLSSRAPGERCRGITLHLSGDPSAINKLSDPAVCNQIKQMLGRCFFQNHPELLDGYNEHWSVEVHKSL